MIVNIKGIQFAIVPPKKITPPKIIKIETPKLKKKPANISPKINIVNFPFKKISY